MNQTLEVVILAAGQGTRMRSALPKVLHVLGGRPLLEHVVNAASVLQPERIHVVVGHGSDAVREAMAGRADNLIWVEQAEQHGTGHAVLQALPGVGDDATVLVMYGDVPLVDAATLAACAKAARDGGLGLVTADFNNPAELGRIVRDATGSICRIVEFKDADPAERAITEINSGIMALGAKAFRDLLHQVEPGNAQGEYYLTDVIAVAVASGIAVQGIKADRPEAVAGVNDRAQLAELERAFQWREAHRLMEAGATIADPARLDVRGHVSVGQDCFIDVNVVLEGRVVLGERASIGAGVVIKDSELGCDVRIEPHTVIEGATIADGCILGPFARIRPGSEFASGVKIGNFVETKKVYIGAGTKASHLTYLGDTEVGAGCNVGAGTVTCNYDGIDKHRTVIGDEVFIGTNATLVAPVTIEDGAFIAAGSTVTARVNEGELAVGRGRQRNIKGWVRPDQRKPGKRKETPAD